MSDLSRQARQSIVAVIRLCCLLAAGLVTTAALAHKSSDAYLSWQVDHAAIEERVDIALRDLDRDLALDANNDGQLSWGEVRGRWAEITDLAEADIQLSADGQGCVTTQRGEPQLDEHSDGRYVVLTRSLHCAGDVHRLAVDYRLFASSDATHRGVAKLIAGTTRTALLVPGAAPTRFELADNNGAGDRGFFGFVVEGMHHIAVGLDHLLFLVTLLMVAVWRRDGRGWVPRASATSAWRETLRLVSAFTVAHSLTIGLAASGVLAPPSRWIESLIAASVLVAALDNLRPFVRGPRWIMVALFGLVHGFGFAGPLQALGLAKGNLALPLLGFNLGVEIGQLAVVALLLPLACLLRGAQAYRVGVVRGGSTVIATIALVWMAERSLDFTIWP
jgi:hypothetical protein